jgi:hypothetical protein
VLDRLPAIEIEIVFRVQGLDEAMDPARVFEITPETSPLIGDGRLERAGVTGEIAYGDVQGDPAEHAVEATYEGLYELAEDALDDGASTLLDDHFGALGGWIAATLVKLADLR